MEEMEVTGVFNENLKWILFSSLALFLFFLVILYSCLVFLEVSSLCVYIKDRYVPSNSPKLWSVHGWFITFAASPHSVQLLQ